MTMTTRRKTKTYVIVEYIFLDLYPSISSRGERSVERRCVAIMALGLREKSMEHVGRLPMELSTHSRLTSPFFAARPTDAAPLAQSRLHF